MSMILDMGMRSIYNMTYITLLLLYNPFHYVRWKNKRTKNFACCSHPVVLVISDSFFFFFWFYLSPSPFSDFSVLNTFHHHLWQYTFFFFFLLFRFFVSICFPFLRIISHGNMWRLGSERIGKKRKRIWTRHNRIDCVWIYMYIYMYTLCGVCGLHMHYYTYICYRIR